MEYLAEKSQKCEMKLKELDFLNNESLVFKALDVDEPIEQRGVKEFNSMDTIDEEEYPFPIFKTDDNFFCLSEDDNDIDLKNEETFGDDIDLKNEETFGDDNDIDLKNEETFGDDEMIAGGQSFEPSLEAAAPAPECKEEDDFETLEKSDFETLEISVADEKGCSIM